MLLELERKLEIFMCDELASKKPQESTLLYKENISWETQKKLFQSFTKINLVNHFHLTILAALHVQIQFFLPEKTPDSVNSEKYLTRTTSLFTSKFKR